MILTLTLNSNGQRQLMARHKLEFIQFGITEDAEAVIDRLVDLFNEHTRGQVTIDELLLHPRDALVFCDHVRTSNGWFGLPRELWGLQFVARCDTIRTCT